MTIETTAREFFEACETGKGWDECQKYCQDDATFDCQSDALADTKSLEGYANWMKGLLTPLPDGHYELKGFASDEERSTVLAFGSSMEPKPAKVGQCHRPGKQLQPTTSMQWSLPTEK